MTLMRVSLFKPTWPLWKAVETMMEQRNLMGAAHVNGVGSVHLVLVPPEHAEKFAAVMNEFYESIREGRIDG